jgi:predicted nucleic acid-binding protein
MTKVFVDSDVIIDFIIDREPFSDFAANLFDRFDNKEMQGFTSAQSLANLYYVLRKQTSHSRIIQAIEELVKLIGILPIDLEIINQALRSGFSDFEDGIQNFCAVAAGADVIVTRNVRDYRESAIPVFDPESFDSYFLKIP